MGSLKQNKIKTWYVVSDVHSFYKELINALKVAGYSKKDPTKGILILGDLFDRGEESLEVYNFIMSIPKSRRILIKGNHEELFLDLLKKDYPDTYDFSNGTVKTFCNLAQFDYDNFDIYGEFVCLEDNLANRLHADWKQVKEIVSTHPIVKWLESDEWKDYYELDKYIFVHSFIPLHNIDGLPSCYIRERKFEYFNDWRNSATKKEFSDSRWGCPWRLYIDGYFNEEIKNNKTLVCGHWHTGDFYASLAFNRKYLRDCAPIYFGKNIIGIDGGCMYNSFTHKYIHPQNVLVIDSKMKICNKQK